MFTHAEKIKAGMIILSLVLVAIGFKMYANSQAVGITKLVEVETEMNLIKLDNCYSRRQGSSVLMCDLFLKDKAGNAFTTNLRLSLSEITDLNNMKNDIKFKLLKITHEKDQHVTCLRKMTLVNNYNLVDENEEYKLSQMFMSCPYFKSKKEYLKERENPFEGMFSPWYKKIVNQDKKKVDNWNLE